MSKNWSWKRTGPSKDEEFACPDNPGKKYLEQNGVIQYNWTGKQKFGICFCMFLTAICKV